MKFLRQQQVETQYIDSDNNICHISIGFNIAIRTEICCILRHIRKHNIHTMYNYETVNVQTIIIELISNIISYVHDRVAA